MKTAPELVVDATQAIRANFALRNTRGVIGSPLRRGRLVAERRRQIQEWIGVLRIARDPSNALSIQHITNAGPLMAHDLRRRVLSLA